MPIIETRNLCKRYGTVMRVTNLALQVPEGSIYGFLGPNGAGKSTTLKMILGLVRPTQGGDSGVWPAHEPKQPDCRAAPGGQSH